MSEPQLGPIVTSSETVGHSVCYGSVTLEGHEYRIGDCAYFSPDSFTFNVKLPPAAKKSKQEQTETKQVLTTHIVVIVRLACFPLTGGEDFA